MFVASLMTMVHFFRRILPPKTDIVTGHSQLWSTRRHTAAAGTQTVAAEKLSRTELRAVSLRLEQSCAFSVEIRDLGLWFVIWGLGILNPKP